MNKNLSIIWIIVVCPKIWYHIAKLWKNVFKWGLENSNPNKMKTFVNKYLNMHYNCVAPILFEENCTLPVARLLLDFDPVTAWLFPILLLWWFHRRLYQTKRKLLWTRQFALLLAENEFKPPISTYLIFF